jgi:hypothetical protein
MVAAYIKETKILIRTEMKEISDETTNTVATQKI